ncbi:MAG: hypothetical protein LBM77_01870 [Spirochaetaceae bacterium]|jgi:hypothetical protein|nr:hypothetical protein [Spirochaetaceae bacterium]
MRKSSKFLIWLIILILLGGTVFYFGWVQLKVPPGSVGVVRSKTHGINTELVREGRFCWLWYALIPTNVNLSIFTPDVQQKSININGMLPSGDIYRNFIGTEASNNAFSYKIDGSISFSVRPDAIPLLMEERNIENQAALEQYEASLSQDIISFIQQEVFASAGNSASLQKLMQNEADSSLLGAVIKQFPLIENVSLTLNTVQYPDFALYDSARGLYQEYLALQSSQMNADIENAAQRRVQLQTRISELAQYGELLQKYPVLLDYLRLEGVTN